MVEVQKLRTFYDFYHARATLCGDSRGRGSKTEDFLRFLTCARDPLRRFAWSRFKNCGLLRFLQALCGDSRGRGSKTGGFFTISSMRARPSAEICVVEVQKLRTFWDFCKPRAPLCEDRACRSALAVAPCEFVAREMAFESCLVARASALAIPRSRVRFPPGPRQLRLEHRSF